MGFGQGLSGLNAAAQNLDVIGNNIANAGTVGYKTGSATFADVYANSRVGLGVQMTGVKQRFTTGNVALTGNMFDMAIDGEKGFFRVTDTSGAVSYTRNGQFFADKNAFIVNAQEQRLTGYIIDPVTGNVGTTLEPLTVPRGDMAPQATTEITTVANFDSNSPIIRRSGAGAKAFDPGDPSTYSNRQTSTVYDSLGNSHELAQYFTKVGGQWELRYTLDGQQAGAVQSLSFDTSGRLTTTPTKLDVNLGTPSGAAPLTVSIDYAGTTSFAKSFGAKFTTNGYAAGEYLGMSIAKDGTLLANYSNGESKASAILALADFNNVQGLQPVGGNAWVETSESGQPVMGQPGSNGLATIKGQAVEESNVDMSQELVNMIIAQRTYQANAQTIKTQDQVLQTLITMR